MSWFTIQVDPPVLNWYNPNDKIHWHFSVQARSHAEALRIIQTSPHCSGMPARMCPPLG